MNNDARTLNQFLRMAVVAGVESAVQIHIARGDDLNARDASGMTPLMLAAARNRPAICKLLLSAGVDQWLQDLSGRTALQIAIAAGSEAAAAVLQGDAHSPIPAHRFFDITAEKRREVTFASVLPVPESATLIEPKAPASPPRQTELPVQERDSSDVIGELHDGEFDLSGWEAEHEPTRPENDLVVMDSATAVQVAITAHEPIDSSAEWDDIEAYLPDVALPLTRANDAEGRALLRRLLLRALREGSVPSLDVQDLSANEDRSANPEAEAYLAMVINDLGAEVDERFEYSDAAESFEVFIDSNETATEEAALDEALAAIDRAASPRHEPLRIYQREFQRLRLLTAEEEVQLAKDMEAALHAALDALASWPDGLERTLAAGAAAVAGTRLLSSIWVGSEPDPERAMAEGVVAGELAPAELEAANEDDDESEDEARADAGDATFAEALSRLAVVVETDGSPEGSPQQIHQALADLRLNRRFLLELVDAANGTVPCPGFRRAMADFCKARDRMTAANLKLAFFHAKKYLYSGEPLDDLAQEGNIGLLKAVDRYDWRRGFRFSTYATWWIRQQISRHVADKARTIRVPVHMHEKLQQAERISQAFEAAVAREPTVDELAERMGMARHKVVKLLRIAPEPSSIDQATVDGMIAIDALDAYTSPDPEDVVGEIQLNRAVDQFVSSLSTKDHKEERILRMRFGIGVNEVLTLEEIGMRFEVTRERIRQIEVKAIRKLRHPVRSEPFARMALGLEPEENRLAPSVHGNVGNEAPDVSEAPPLLMAKPQAPPNPPGEPTQPAGLYKSTSLDRVLTQAAELGVPVEDGRRTTSGRIWVGLVATPDNPHRRLARKLIEFGFEHSPGRGYWR